MQHIEFIKMLFEDGHDAKEIIDWKDRREHTALHYAAEVGNVKVNMASPNHHCILIYTGPTLIFKSFLYWHQRKHTFFYLFSVFLYL